MLTITVQAPFDVAAQPAKQCVTLRNGEPLLQEVCSALPEVLPPANRSGKDNPALGATPAPAAAHLSITFLGDAAGEQTPGQVSTTLVVHNDGASPARGAYLYLEIDGIWRLSDVMTTLGLVSIVDHAAVVRIGRLDANAPVAVTLAGGSWAAARSPSALPWSLMARRVSVNVVRSWLNR